MSLYAKNYTSDLPEIIRRDRLFSRLNQTPVCWITAPPGAGKTVLVKSYIASLQSQYIWYQLDSSDGEVATFFQWFGVTINNSLQNQKSDWPLFTSEYTHGLEVFSKHFFERLYSCLSKPFTLVFDDYHSLPVGGQFDQILHIAFKSLPAEGKIIIISRSQPSAMFARLQVNQVIQNIGWEDIKFSDLECEKLLKLRGITNEDKVRYIQKQTHGWVSGIVLMANQVNRAISVRLDNVWSEDYQLMFDYFAAEIFDDSEERIQKLLLQTALLPSMTTRMAAKVSGQDEKFVRDYFEKLYAESYFTNRHPDIEERYEFHPLFREFLLMQCKKRYSHNELLQLKQKAGDVLHDSDYYRAAAKIWIELENWKKLSDICVNKAPMLLSTGSNNTFLNWIKYIPESFYSAQQWLRYWHAQILSPYDPNSARQILRSVYERFKKENDVEGQFLSLAAAADTYFHDWVEYSSSNVWIDDIKELKSRHPEYPSRDVEMHMAAGLIIFIIWYTGNDEEFPWLIKRCHVLLKELADPNQKIILAFQLVWYHCFQGYTEANIEVVKILNSSIDEDALLPANRIRWHCILANYYCYAEAEYDQVLVHTKKAREISDMHGIQLMTAIVIVQEIYATLMQGDFRGVDKKLSQLWALVNPGMRLEVYYYYLSGWASLGQGKLEKAEQDLNKAVKLINKMEMENIVLSGYINNVYAITNYARGKLDAAAQCFSRLEKSADITDSKLLKWIALLFKAFKEGASDSEDAQKSLHNALCYGRENHLFCFPGQIERFLIPLYIAALKLDIETEYVKKLIKMQRIKPDLQSRLISNWPWKIRVYALGDLKIEMDDEALIFTGKQQRRPLELLKLIIANNGQALRVSQAIDALWPDASVEAGENNFKTTLARLRKLVGKETIELVDARISIDGDYLWVDAWTILELIKQIDVKAGKNIYQAEDYHQIMSLYKGDFLKGGESSYWVLSYRDQLKLAYLRIIEKYSKYLLDCEEYSLVVEISNKVLETDELSEVFYKLLMKANIKLGNQAEVVKTYRRCQRIFSERLSIEPSAETKLLLASVSKSDT